MTFTDSCAPTRFSFAVNSAGRDKDWDYEILATKYRDTEGTITDVIHHVSHGHALCTGLLNGKRRAKANVSGSQWILLDIDNSKGLTDSDGNPLDDQGRPIRIGRQSVDVSGNPIDKPDGRKQGKVYDHQLSIEEAIAHPFIKEHAALIYTSASHKPDWHKFRIIFLLPELVEGSDTIEALVRFLMAHLPHDPACKDASRVFYGNSKAEFPLINPTAVLPHEWIEQAQAAAVAARAEHEQRLEQAIARRAQLKATAEQEGWDFDALVDQALSFIPPRQQGSGNYDECRQVLMALHSHFGEAAEAIAERWSPSIAGTTWNISQKLRSFKRNDGIGIGTLFHTARQYGFKFPELERSAPGDKDFLAWLEEQDRIEAVQAEAQANENFINKIFRYLETGKKKKRRKRVEVESRITLEDLGTYAPGAIPANVFGKESSIPKHFAEIRTPGTAYKLWYEPGTEAVLYQEAIAQGWHILDTSPTGSGKTQRAGQLRPEDFVFDQDGQLVEPTLIYMGSDHRNPKTASVEVNFADVPNRHNGMVIDKTHQTALGRDYIVNPKAEYGPAERLPGNCIKANEFAVAKQKGLTWASATATANPICLSCPYFGTCGDPTAEHPPGSGFRALRAEALRSPRLRMSPDQYPPNWESDRTINIWDEASQTIAVTDTLTATLIDFNGVWASLEQEEPELHQRLAGVRRELRRLLIGKQPLYGFSRDEILERLHWCKLNLSLDEIERIRDATAPSLADFFGAVDRVDTTEITRKIANLKATIQRRNQKHETLGAHLQKLKSELSVQSVGVLFGGIDERVAKEQIAEATTELKLLADELKQLQTELRELEQERETLKAVSRQVQNSDRREQSEKLANTFVCWLAPLLEVILGWTIGTIAIQHGKLEIHQLKQQHRRIIHEAHANIFLDATATVESLSFRTGIPVEKILVVEAIHDQGAAVHHVQVKDFGLAAKKRADSTDERIKAVIAGAVSQHEGCHPVVFDHLNKAQATAAQGVHFRDSRGENSFINNDIYIHVGLPMPNIGAVRIEYEILGQDAKGTPPSLEAYYQGVCDAELFQEMGRDRALRRDGTIFHYWLTDLELPFEAQTMTAAELSINAASQADITRAEILKAIAKLAKDGGKMTQQAIADLAQVTQGWVSKFFAGLGGWQVWRKIITSLIKSSITTSNNFDTALEILTEDERWIAQTWLSELVTAFEDDPQSTAESLAATALAYGAAAWARILRAADRRVVAQLLGQMLSVMPDWVWRGLNLDFASMLDC
jgi:Primase C terminal 2 (PriCT-2)